MVFYLKGERNIGQPGNGVEASSIIPVRGAGQGPGTLRAGGTCSFVAPSQPDVSFRERDHSHGQRRRTGKKQSQLPRQTCPPERPRGLLEGGVSLHSPGLLVETQGLRSFLRTLI